MKIGGTLSVSGFSVSDPSLPTAEDVTAVFTANQGVISLSTSVPGGITNTQVIGNVTSNVTVTASLAAINATLSAASGLTYTPASNYHGLDTLSLAASDRDRQSGFGERVDHGGWATDHHLSVNTAICEGQRYARCQRDLGGRSIAAH